MKRFLKKTSIYGSILFSVFSIFFYITNTLVKKKFNYNLDPKINTLIVGDSHTLCSVDDSLILNSINLSESADTYFYTYIKVREITSKNPQIKKIVLGYAQHNINESQDKWLFSQDINSKKLPFYFFLFNKKDLKNFIAINPKVFFENSVFIVRRNLGHLFRIYKNEKINNFGIGTHLKLYNKFNDSIKKNHIITPLKNKKKEIIDLTYLKMIYQHCIDNNIKLILLNTPVYHKDNCLDIEYFQYYKNYLPKAELLDYSNDLQLKDYFADATHLNNNGSIIFSKILEKKINQQ